MHEVLNGEREHYVLDNINLVDYILQKRLGIKPYNINYDDYQQEGRLGLILAAIRYDESSGYEFSTYASHYILGHARRYRREFLYRKIHISRSALDLLPRISQMFIDGKSAIEIIGELGITDEEFEEVMCGINIGLLDAPIGRDSDGKEMMVSDIIGEEDKNIVDILGEERIIEAIEYVASKMKDSNKRGV